MAEYANPIIYGDYSDPDPIRVGDDFYMVASSFTYAPGIPILHSRDMVHWEIVNYALRTLPFEKYSKPSHGSGAWAPAIRYRNGEFLIFIPFVDEGIMVARSKDILGDFELNMLAPHPGWIDPCPIWLDDGRAFMVFAYARSRAGINNVIALVEIDPECRRVLGNPEIIFDGNLIAPISEGPKAYLHDGDILILFPAGGVERGWQCCIRSRDIHGPYEYRVVMHQGRSSTRGAHQGGWVTAPDGSDWFLHFQDAGELGRIIHLQPMRFIDGWPMMGADIDGDGIGEPVQGWRMPVDDAPRYSIAASDGFDSERLGLQWQWQANPDDGAYSLSRRNGFLSLRCMRNRDRENLMWYSPHVLTEIPQSDSFTATAYAALDGKVDGDYACIGFSGHLYGLIGIAFDGHGYSIRAYRGRVTGTAFEGEAEESLVEVHPMESDHAYLRIELRKDMNYVLSYSEDGEHFSSIKRIFPLVRGTWTGAKLLLWASNRKNAESEGWGEFDYLCITR